MCEYQRSVKKLLEIEVSNPNLELYAFTFDSEINIRKRDVLCYMKVI